MRSRLAACLLAGAVLAAPAIAASPAPSVEALRGRIAAALRARPPAGLPKKAIGVASAAVAALYAVNLATLSVVQADRPLAERARAAGRNLLAPEMHVALGGFLAGDLAARRTLGALGIGAGSLARIVLTPAVGEVVAEVALGLLTASRLSRTTVSLELDELDRVARARREPGARLRGEHARLLGEPWVEGVVRDLTDGSIDHAGALVSGGGWAVGALAGSALGGPLAGIAGGMGGAVAARSALARIRERGLDAGDLRDHARRLARGGLLDVRDDAPCDRDPATCAAWFRGRRAAHANLLRWGAEGLTRAADAYFELAAAGAGAEDPGAVRRLRLGMGRAGAAVEVLEESRAAALARVSPSRLRELGYPRDFRLVMAASRRVELRLLRELRRLTAGARGDLEAAGIELAAGEVVPPGTGSIGAPGAGGLFGQALVPAAMP